MARPGLCLEGTQTTSLSPSIPVCALCLCLPSLCLCLPSLANQAYVRYRSPQHYALQERVARQAKVEAAEDLAATRRNTVFVIVGAVARDVGSETFHTLHPKDHRRKMVGDGRADISSPSSSSPSMMSLGRSASSPVLSGGMPSSACPRPSALPSTNTEPRGRRSSEHGRRLLGRQCGRRVSYEYTSNYHKLSAAISTP